jgi:hypothetical protein
MSLGWGMLWQHCCSMRKVGTRVTLHVVVTCHPVELGGNGTHEARHGASLHAEVHLYVVAWQRLHSS